MVDLRIYRVMQDGRQSVCIKDSDKGAVEEISLKAWGINLLILFSSILWILEPVHAKKAR